MAENLIIATISLHNMGGGLERNVVKLANHFTMRGLNVHLITFDLPGAQAFYNLDSAVQWHCVGNSQPHKKIGFNKRWAILKEIRNVIKSCGRKTPVICFHHGILLRFWLANLFLGNPIICSERNALSLYNHIKSSKWNLNFLMLFLARAITVQFPAYIHDYPAPLRTKITAIPNPVDIPNQKAQVDKPDERGRYTLLCVTRLSMQKNLDILIRVFADLAANFPEWDLKIVGDGEMQGELESLISALKMETRIILCGKKSDVSMYFLNAHLFCLPSKWEGFPNAMAEALSFGLPCISYIDCSGANQLIEDGFNGLLAIDNRNTETLKQSLRELMSDPQKRKDFGHNAIKSMHKYAHNQVMRQWEHFIEKLM